LYEFTLQLGPVLLELFGARKTAVSADADDVADAVLDQIGSRFAATFALLEIHAARTADDRSALTDHKPLVQWRRPLQN